jgi:hypothetical protein
MAILYIVLFAVLTWFLLAMAFRQETLTRQPKRRLVKAQTTRNGPTPTIRR